MFDGANEQPQPHPAPVQQDPLETTLAQEWQAAQLGQQHIGAALGRIIEAWRQTRGELAAAVARIVTLEAGIAERDAQLAAQDKLIDELRKEQVPGIVQWARGEIETIPALSGKSAEVQKQEKAARDQAGINDDPMAAEREAWLAAEARKAEPG